MRRWLWLIGPLSFLLTGLILMSLYACVHRPPPRPPTGNHGQGHSPSSDCPGQYRQPVEVDDIQFPLTCFGKIAHLSKGLETQPSPWTEETMVFYSTADGKMISDFVKVPKVPGETSYVCFRLIGKSVEIQCFYINGDKTVTVRGVTPDPEPM